MTEPIHIGFATQNDAKDIFLWRNDVTTRRMSKFTGKISWEDHVRWYTSSLNNPKVCILMCYFSKTKQSIGVVRFDVEIEEAKISVNLSPSMRGRGFASLCLIASINFFKRKFPQIKALVAEIKKENIVSQKAFQQAGFNLEHQDEQISCFIHSVPRK